MIETELIQNLLKDSSFKGIVLHRAQFQGRRCYINPDPFKVYSGLTSAMEAATFKGNMEAKRLDSWRLDQVAQMASVEKHEQHMDAMATFGTKTHEALVDIWRTKEFVFDQEAAREYFMESDKKSGIPHNEGTVTKRVFAFHKAICSLMQFVYDEVSEIIAIETMACSDQYSISTPCDVIYRDKKGVLCNVNIKTSNQIGEHHRNQVALEKWLWNTTYENDQVQKTGVLRFKDWLITKVPTYELEFVKDDAERVNNWLRKFDCVLAEESSTYANFNKQTRIFEGKIKLGEAPKIVTKTIEQAFMESQEITV